MPEKFTRPPAGSPPTEWAMAINDPETEAFAVEHIAGASHGDTAASTIHCLSGQIHLSHPAHRDPAKARERLNAAWDKRPTWNPVPEAAEAPAEPPPVIEATKSSAKVSTKAKAPEPASKPAPEEREEVEDEDATDS